jgi:hypothetical protein
VDPRVILRSFTVLLLSINALIHAQAPADSKLPRIETRDGRFALIVEGKPYLMLGAQINNSSSWASTLPEVWPDMEAMHVNTVEAPVYWEQMEPTEGAFDFSSVDLLVSGARKHNLHLVLLWFGTWKNGQAHYVPEWIKTNPGKYPREISSYGKVLDVLSPHSATNLQADAHAFSALLHHLREIDGSQHTVIMMQVENESGSIGTVRDHSAAADREFSSEVPAMLHTAKGTWSQIYGTDAEERFAAYATAHYINEVARAGKVEYHLPMYCNVWITYPVRALENRNHPSPGQEYPSGGPQQGNIAIWKAAAPEIDLLGPDFYSDDRRLFRDVVSTYSRRDNPLFIPEIGRSSDFGPNFFFALGKGAIGFSPFGVDYTGWHLKDVQLPVYLSEDFALFQPMDRKIAQLVFEGKLQTAVEQKGAPEARLHFSGVDALIAYGFPQRDGETPPGTADTSGRVMVAQLGPYEFLVTGFDASVTFTVSDVSGEKTSNEQIEILRAEDGQYMENGWHMFRIWNGDQTDRGLQFTAGNKAVIRIFLHKLPLHSNSR